MLTWFNKQETAVKVAMIIAVVLIFLMFPCCSCLLLGALTDTGKKEVTTVATTTTKKPIATTTTKKPAEKKPAPKPAASKPQDLPLAQQTEATIKSIVKKATGISLSKVEIVQQGSYIKVVYFSDSLWDENDCVFDTCEKAVKIMPVVFKIEGVKIVDIVLQTGFTDVYGKKLTDDAVLIGLDKVEADKVNWKEINSANRAGIMNVATAIIINPAVKKDIDNEDILKALAYYDLKRAQQ